MLFTLIFPFILQFAASSLVLDSIRQQGIHIDEHCPKSKYCAEGTHVMCMYYDPTKIFGPSCSNPRNLTITPALADSILDIANAIRGKLAQGTEKGKDGELLPRAYGMFKLAWDKELATFAQVFANQCLLKHDLCRATKRFSSPGQTVGLQRYTFPDWEMYSNAENYTAKGLTPEKVEYGSVRIFKNWYKEKNYVNKSMIMNYPDFNPNPMLRRGQLYLEMIYGPATHMGCGISAYSEYVYHKFTSGKHYNTVLLVCNYSASPRSSSGVYNTVPPSDTEPSVSKCGCPFGSEETSDCLCVIEGQELENSRLSTKDCNEGSCDPTVVVLPIFTMEDTPPDHISNSLSNATVHKSTGLRQDIFDEYENDNLRNKHKKYSNGLSRRLNTLQQDKQKTDLKISVKKRHFDKKEIETNHVDNKYNIQSMRMPLKHIQQKSSIFTRASRFSLPTARSSKQYDSINSIKRDVIPRKDFSDAKKLVDKYINYGKNSLFRPIERKSAYNSDHDLHHLEKNKNPNEIIKPHSVEEISHDNDHLAHNTESSLNLIEQNVVHHDDFMKDLAKDPIFNHNEPIQSITATTDNKLMNLLDTLEREVKHIELKDKDKEIFDEKIRKIYGKVVGKPVESLGIKFTIPDKHENDIHIVDHLEKLKTDSDHHLDKFKTERDDPLNKLRTDKDDHLDKPRTEIDGNLDKIITGRDNPSDKFRTDTDDHLDKLRTNRDNPLDQIKTDKNDRLDKLRTEMDDNLDKFRTDGEDNLDKLRTNREDPLDKLRPDNRDNHLSNLRTDKDDRLDKLRTDRRMFNENPNILNKHELHKNKNDLSFELYDDPTAANHHTVQRKVRDRSLYRNNDVDSIYRNKNSYTNIEHNGIDSHDNKYENFDFNYRKDPYKREHYNRKSLSMHANREDHKTNHKNYYLNHEGDPLSEERRKYYQDKLNNIERRINRVRNHKRRTVTEDRHMRAMLTPHVRKTGNQLDSFYIPDRARFLHGY